MTNQVTDTSEQSTSHRTDFWLLLLLFLSFRFLSLLLLRPGGFIRDWSDFDTFLGIAALSDYGLYPFLDFWLEWPPLVPWLMVGAYKLSLLLPPWEDHRLWFVLILGTVFLLFEGGNFVLIYRLARRVTTGPATTTRVLWLYAGLFPPLYATLGFFDSLALFFILLSLDLILTQRTRWSALAIGTGFMAKVTPILMLPVAIKYAWHRHAGTRFRIAAEWAWITVIIAMTILLLATPFLLIAPEWSAAFFHALWGRSSWETVWAVLEGYYGFGQVAGDRLNPAETMFAIHPATLPWHIITLAFAAFYALIFFLKADFTQPRRVVAFAGLTISLFLLYSKGYSPQFLVYILPFIILLLPNLAGLGYALLLTLLNVLEQPIYFVIFDPAQFPAESWLLTAVVIARFIVWLALSLEFVMIIGWWTAPAFRRGMRWALTGGTMIGLLLLIPNGLNAYNRVQLARSPHQALISFLQTQATRPPMTLILTEQALYRQLYPYLHTSYNLKLAGGEADFPAAPAPAQLVEGEAQVWLLSTGDRGPAVAETLRGPAEPLATYDFDPSGSLSLLDLRGNGSPPEPLARAENGLSLINYHLEIKPSALTLVLYWQTDRPQKISYTVFSQLLDAVGQLITGHDSLPADNTQPTPTWLPNQVIVDTHHLPLPPDLPPGEYRLIVGMYDPEGNRLLMRSPAGYPFEDSAVPLTAVNLP
jgi:hypothetical protein